MSDLWAVMDYLLYEGLITPEEVVEGDLRIAEARSRNSCYQVTGRTGPRYLLKRSLSEEGVSTVGAEAAVYSFLSSATGASRLRPFLPRFYRYDAGERLLVLELIAGAETVLDYHRRRGHFSLSHARQLAAALSALHSLRAVHDATTPADRSTWRDRAPNHLEPPALQSKEPWVLAIHHPGLGMLGDMSAANAQFASIIQRYAPFEALLDGLRREWCPSVLIHGDVKWANCLLHRPEGERHAARLKLVDWEFAGWGDPCWDLGSVFADYLNFWLLSIPVGEKEDPGAVWALAHYPIESMQPAMRAFWEEYCEQSGLDTESRISWLVRSVRYASARLLQTAFEQNQQTAQLSSNMILLLQLSLNMLQRPVEAILQLLGLPLTYLHTVSIPAACAEVL